MSNPGWLDTGLTNSRRKNSVLILHLDKVILKIVAYSEISNLLSSFAVFFLRLIFQFSFSVYLSIDQRFELLFPNGATNSNAVNNETGSCCQSQVFCQS